MKSPYLIHYMASDKRDIVTMLAGALRNTQKMKERKVAFIVLILILGQFTFITTCTKMKRKSVSNVRTNLGKFRIDYICF